MMMLSIVAVTADFHFAIDEDGSQFPIAELYDSDKDLTEDPLEATIAVAALPGGVLVVFDCEGIDQMAVN